MNSTQYLMQGLSYYGEGDYTSAIVSYENALLLQDKALQDNTAVIYTNKATALTKLMKYEEAIHDYTFAIDYDILSSPAPYYGRGVVMMKILDYHKAINDFTSAIQFSDNFGLAYYGRAAVYMKLGKYKDAEKDYKKLIELWHYLPSCALFYNGLGNAKYKLGEYVKAIEYYDAAIKTDPNFVAAYNNRGNAYYKLTKYNEAQKDFNTAITLNPRNEKQYQWQYLFDYALPDFVDDIETYLIARKFDNLFTEEFLVNIFRLMKEGKEDYSQIAKILISSNNYFLTTTASDIDNRYIYSILYIQVMKIVALLHIDNITFPISHYTSIGVAKSLLFESSPLRFSNVVKANDEYEGMMLHLFLNIKQDFVSNNQAYIACFVLGADEHNMFRLYGKTNNEENSGICLSLNKDFFFFFLTFNMNDKQEKSSLFRCIYIHYNKNNPNELMYVTDVGGNIDEDTSHIKTETQTALSILKTIIDNNTKLKTEIINKLITPLQYLIKIDSWKEEKECRILKIVSPNNPLVLKDKITKRTFLNYSVLNNFMTDIYIGCNAFKDEESRKEFINNLKVKFPNVHCMLSRHKNRT